MAPTKTLDVVGIGNAIVDVLVHADDDQLDNLELTKGTMALVDEEQAERLYASVGPGLETSGGSAANTLAGIAQLGGRAGFPWAQRAEVSRFIEDLTASDAAGWMSVISLHGGGSPAAMKQEIYRNYPIGSKVELVERILERGVAHDPDRAITKNRQPGKCCDDGCSAPGTPVMVDLPTVEATLPSKRV